MEQRLRKSISGTRGRQAILLPLSYIYPLMYFTTQPAILQDFDKFLDFLGQSGQLELTKGKGELRNADLLRFNDAMHR